LHGALQDEGLFQSGVRYHLVLRSDAKHRVSKDAMEESVGRPIDRPQPDET